MRERPAGVSNQFFTVMRPTNDIALTNPSLGSCRDGGSSHVRGIRVC